jgi:hypothetical protein
MACLNFLNDYAEYLNQSDLDDPRPHPMFFPGDDCTGTTWYDMSRPVIGTITNPYIGGGWLKAPLLRSLFIPPGWNVTLYNSGDTDHIDIPSSLQYTVSSVTIPSLAGYNMNSGTPVQNHSVTAHTSTNITLEKWKYDSCMGLRSDTVGMIQLTRFRPGTPDCDDFMLSYCNSVQNNDDACSCLTDEATLKNTYCHPDSTEIYCQDSSDFSSFMPVSCFGKQCSSDGYKFYRMRNQTCSTLLCRQVIDIIGDNTFVDGGSTIWCGNQHISNETKQTQNNIQQSETDTDTETVIETESVVGLYAFYIILGIFSMIGIIVVLYIKSTLLKKNGKKQTNRTLTFRGLKQLTAK